VIWNAADRADSYQVFYGEDRGALSKDGGQTGGLSLTVSGLTPNTSYYFAVRAGNKNGWSSLSSSVNAVTEQTYTVTASPSDHGSVIPNPTSAEEGTVITLNISAEADYRLKSLAVKDAADADVAVSGTGTSRTFTMPASNVTVTVEFEALPANVYSVMVNPASHGNVTASPANAGAGTTIILTISPEADYQLKSLTVKDAANADITVNGTGTSRTFTMPASNVTVSMEFEALPANVYSITVNPISLGNVTASPANAGAETTITLTINPDTGYQLKSLTVKDAADTDITVSGTGTSRTFAMPASNVTISAEFELSLYSVTVSAASHGSVAANLANAEMGTTITLTASPDTGYQLKSLAVKDAADADVTVSGTGTTRTFAMPASNVRVIAEFELSLYSVTISAAAHGSVAANSVSAGTGTTITLTISPDTGYQLKSLAVKDAADADITVSGTGTSRTFALPASNVTVIAEFELSLYSVTVNAASHGSVAANPENAEMETTITLTASPDTGYQLKDLAVKDAANADVTVNGTGTSRTFTMPASNVTVNAEFELSLYSVTVSAASHGNITTNSVNAGMGTTITLTVSPETGYQLKSLTVKDAADADITVSGTGTSRTFAMPASNVTVSAEFEEAAYGLFIQNGATLSRIFSVESPFSIFNALAWLGANAEADTTYVIAINANETLVPITLSSANLSGKTGVKITLRGLNAERTVQLASSGSLFTVQSGITLSLDENITLKGRNDHIASLVRVSSGAVIMEQGAKISGNTSSSGGGVYVAGGTFTLNGGQISSNRAFGGYGGGVYVSGGTFTINSGEISGNTGGSSGGGVYVAGGTFIMSDGEISGNTASSNGGGVYVYGGTFTMSDGGISGNTASSNGGGVYVYGGTFTMSNGEISDNTSSGSGGGVYTDSAFTMGNGEISGNTSSGNGGGVYVADSSTFKKQPATESGTSGAIYGYTGYANGNKVTSGGSVQSGRGHAVYMASSPVKKREATAGETQHMDSEVAGPAGGWE
jgi:predicted secreted protein